VQSILLNSEWSLSVETKRKSECPMCGDSRGFAKFPLGRNSWRFSTADNTRRPLLSLSTRRRRQTWSRRIFPVQVYVVILHSFPASAIDGSCLVECCNAAFGQEPGTARGVFTVAAKRRFGRACGYRPGGTWHRCTGC
jgi:hypothetical protein